MINVSAWPGLVKIRQNAVRKDFGRIVLDYSARTKPHILTNLVEVR